MLNEQYLPWLPFDVVTKFRNLKKVVKYM